MEHLNNAIQYYTERKEKAQEQIKKLETSCAEFDIILDALKKVCDHKYSDGVSALEYLDCDLRNEYYRCAICEKEIMNP